MSYAPTSSFAVDAADLAPTAHQVRADLAHHPSRFDWMYVRGAQWRRWDWRCFVITIRRRDSRYTFFETVTTGPNPMGSWNTAAMVSRACDGMAAVLFPSSPFVHLARPSATPPSPRSSC